LTLPSSTAWTDGGFIAGLASRDMDTTMVRRAGVKPWSSVDEGAAAIMHLALSPALEGRSGVYFNGLNQARPNAQAYDLDARRRLRTLSLELTGLTPAR
jgi:hypothetical protein